MADSSAIARERMVTDKRIAEASAKLARQSGVAPPRQPQKFMDPRKRDLDRLKAIAEFLERLCGDAPPVEPEPPKPVAEDSGSTEQGYGPNKLPLSYFDGMEDDEILAIEGIGRGTLKKIRDAQFKRDVGGGD